MAKGKYKYGNPVTPPTKPFTWGNTGLPAIPRSWGNTFANPYGGYGQLTWGNTPAPQMQSLGGYIPGEVSNGIPRFT